MPEFSFPGVHLQELESGPRPIEGVPTSIAAFLGETERGSIRPRLVTSYSDYLRCFGSVFKPDGLLGQAVNGFFENGGKQVFICRLVGQSAETAEASFGDFRIRAAGPGSWGSRVLAKIEPSSKKDRDANSVGFRLRLAYWSEGATPFDPFTPEGRTISPQPSLVEDFDDLVVDQTSSDYYGNRLPFIDLDRDDTQQVAESSSLGVLVRNAGVAAEAQPTYGTQVLLGGTDSTARLGVDDYRGHLANGRQTEQGLAALELEPYRHVSLVYAPNVPTDIAKAIVAHCEKVRFRFAVIDSGKGQVSTANLNPRDVITDSSHAAYYYPWIVRSGSRAGERTLVPPGGHVLGIYANTDTERGVFKAPANEILEGALALEFSINDDVQDQLSPKGVNILRSFPGRGIRVWGARTISSNGLWKYVSVKRLFIFLEQSISEGLQWVVFEPNNDLLWTRVGDSIRLFLRTQWRLGAFQGRAEQEAFFVTCDCTTMSQDDILNGRLICEIGVAPVRPAEFIIFRIFQKTVEA